MELELIPGEDGLADLYLLREDGWPGPLVLNYYEAAAVVNSGKVKWPDEQGEE